MLPCEFIIVSLLAIEDSGQPPDTIKTDQQPSLAELPPPTHYPLSSPPTKTRTARVLHLEERCQDSFVEVGFLHELHVDRHGPRSPFSVTNNSRAVLCWRYPSLQDSVITRHRVLRNLGYQVVLGRQDWILPLTRLWLQQQMYQRGDMACLTEDDERRQRAASESDNESDDTISVGNSRRSSSVDSYQETERMCFGLRVVDFEWSEPELIKVDEGKDDLMGTSQQDIDWGDASIDGEENCYWQWSDKHQNWIHQNTDGSVTLIPELD